MRSENSKALIKCKSDSRMHFSRSQSIHITNLEFIGCGGNRVQDVKKFVVKDTMFKGEWGSRTALELIGTAAQIVNSTFVSNTMGSYRECAVLYNNGYCIKGFVGGAIIATNSTVCISQSRFKDNIAREGGGAILAEKNSIINTSRSIFVGNTARFGGVLASNSSTIIIEASKYHGNEATYAGVLTSLNSTIIIEASEFYDNSASFGGVLASSGSNITILEESGFHNNSATREGGVIISELSNITIGGSNFSNNTSPIGAVIRISDRSTIQHKYGYLTVDSNRAESHAVMYLSDSEFVGHNKIIFSNNLGSLVAFNSKINLSGDALFVNNQPLLQNISDNFQEGGAITLFQSNVYFNGACNFEHNHAENGGAIHSTDSKLYVNGDVTLAHNTANRNGGGVYLSNSELNCQRKSTFEVRNNTALHKGGGLHAISSSIKTTVTVSSTTVLYYYYYTGARINFTGNAAGKGGGLSLEANAKLYILKYDYILYDYFDYDRITFTGNSADYGGAIFVDDVTNSGKCASDKKGECFFQVLSLHSEKHPNINTKSMNFSRNYANLSGSTL